MPEVKLHYFDGQAKGELIRVIMSVGGIEFEDKRFSFEEWPEHKPNTPFGQMPVLFWDGEEIAQSMAIAR